MKDINLLLYIAAAFKNKNAIYELIAKGANPNYFHSDDTPLHSSIDNNEDPISIVSALLNCKADPNLQDKFTGDTPLHLAIKYKNFELAKLLIDNGAIISIRNKDQLTPIELADIKMFVQINELAIHR